MFSHDSLAFAYGQPELSGRIRATPKDFQVIEIPTITPTGEGEHRLILVRKTSLNTEQVAKSLAKLARIPQARVSWAGLKDRNAVTEQWFSVHIGHQEDPDWYSLNSEQLKILEVHPHQKKLRKGVLKGNQFFIRVTDLEGDTSSLKQRYEKILNEGVPNYFGEQRFGHNQRNIYKAISIFSNPRKRVRKHERGLCLSAARSHIFNAVLDQRVRDNTWNQLLSGEVCMLNGSQSIFQADDDPELEKRLEAFDIHPTGPMWGRGELMSKSDCRVLEEKIASEHQVLSSGLEKAGLRQERRALRMEPKFFQMQLEKQAVLFSFELPPGCYATTVLRELVRYSTP
jgi:tRNA pseudouridine13 synthase